MRIRIHNPDYYVPVSKKPVTDLLGLALYELPEAGGSGPPQGEVRAAQQQNQTRHQGTCRGM
jgi:hypothetical protein